MALSALLLGFSSLRIDCSHWLTECIPDSCIQQGLNHLFQPQGGLNLLDVDGCLLDLQRNLQIGSAKSPNCRSSQSICSVASRRPLSESPVSVAAIDHPVDSAAEGGVLSVKACNVTEERIRLENTDENSNRSHKRSRLG